MYFILNIRCIHFISVPVQNIFHFEHWCQWKTYCHLLPAQVPGWNKLVDQQRRQNSEDFQHPWLSSWSTAVASSQSDKRRWYYLRLCMVLGEHCAEQWKYQLVSEIKNLICLQAVVKLYMCNNSDLILWLFTEFCAPVIDHLFIFGTPLMDN